MKNEEVLTPADVESINRLGTTFETRKLFWRIGGIFYNGRFIGLSK